MTDEFNLERFEQAQAYSYEAALREVSNGRKRSHWIWYIFPQVKGLGHSGNSQYYGLSGREEAAAYLRHPVLGSRLRRICEALLELETSDPEVVFGGIDAVKLRSSMTIFDLVSPGDVFARVLDKYFGGERDRRTLRLV